MATACLPAVWARTTARERVGASVIPMSGGNTVRQLMLMEDFGSTALCCTPSYALNLADAMEREGITLDRIRLKSGIFGAEPWTEDMRRRIEEKMGIDALNVYGLSEVMGPGVAMECMAKNGMHIWEDHFLPEVIGPDGQSLPYGEQGDLTFTTLTKHGMPLIRYRTHDLCTLTDEPCPCGRTHVRMGRVMGRTDDMLIIRGVNVFPSQIEHALLQVPGIEPHYHIVVDRVGTLDTIEVQVELSPSVMSDTVRDLETLERKIVNSLASHALIHASVKLCQPGTLPPQRRQGRARDRPAPSAIKYVSPARASSVRIPSRVKEESAMYVKQISVFIENTPRPSGAFYQAPWGQ